MVRIPLFRSFRHGALAVPCTQSSPLQPVLHQFRGCQSRYFSTLPARGKGPRSTQLPSRPKPPPEEEIEEFFVKGSGPGGQKINKTNSAVQLRHKPTGIVVKSQATRSRTDNRRIAREHLALKLDAMKNGEKSRVAAVGAFKKKKADSSTKKSKRKYKKLAEQKGDEAAAENDEPELPEEKI